ncbi:hypothetical protein POM88_007827 [Heracleum sosnowskyi]|uniref:Pentatricopeptide repeat-containing protein n=1 Tax=Heracleum sosnowskyi TaxID=360622 RepID=A0AAD8J6X5_9APIA|nr:hypothetical protein POM88_007827 [Heracleum sosnowskyi]
MKVDGIKPDVVCYTMVLDGVIEEGNYAKADELFDEMLVLGVVPDMWTYNVYLCGLFKQKHIDAGMDMLACIENVGCKPDVVMYNGILSTLCESGEFKAAKEKGSTTATPKQGGANPTEQLISNERPMQQSRDDFQEPRPKRAKTEQNKASLSKGKQTSNSAPQGNMFTSLRSLKAAAKKTNFST